MSVSSLALFSTWRDYYGAWNALVEPQFSPLEQSTCHAPRFAVLPDASKQTVPAGGKVEYNFHLVPGSIIIGMLLPGNPARDLSIQLTDVTLGHQFFQEPVLASLLFTPGAVDTALYPAVTLFATPHPVVGDGLFSFEAWADPGDTVVVILLVAEVTDCPVK